MPEEKIVRPDLILKLSDEQRAQIAPLVGKRKMLNAGMILGSVGLSSDTVALKFVSQEVSKQIVDLAYEKLRGKNDVNS